jgi:PKD repeat protein
MVPAWSGLLSIRWTATSTASASSHTFPAAGTYTVTLTVTDGWGKAASTTRQVTVTAT